jgi:hypothetical protein
VGVFETLSLYCADRNGIAKVLLLVYSGAVVCVQTTVLHSTRNICAMKLL